MIHYYYGTMNPSPHPLASLAAPPAGRSWSCPWSRQRRTPPHLQSRNLQSENVGLFITRQAIPFHPRCLCICGTARPRRTIPLYRTVCRWCTTLDKRKVSRNYVSAFWFFVGTFLVAKHGGAAVGLLQEVEGLCSPGDIGESVDKNECKGKGLR